MSRSVFVFLFGTDVAASHNPLDALKILHLRRPDLDIIVLCQSFEHAPLETVTRGATASKPKKPVDRLKEAVGSRKSMPFSLHAAGISSARTDESNLDADICV